MSGFVFCLGYQAHAKMSYFFLRAGAFFAAFLATFFVAFLATFLVAFFATVLVAFLATFLVAFLAVAIDIAVRELMNKARPHDFLSDKEQIVKRMSAYNYYHVDYFLKQIFFMQTCG